MTIFFHRQDVEENNVLIPDNQGPEVAVSHNLLTLNSQSQLGPDIQMETTAQVNHQVSETIFE